MAVVYQYQRGDTVTTVCNTKLYNVSTSNYDYINADASYPTVTITDPNDSVVVNAAIMDYVAVGKYMYRYDVPTNANVGWYHVVHTVQLNSGTHVYKDKSYTGFKVE